MLDNIDLEIINILQHDAKTTYQEIGKRLSVSQGTVHARVRKLSEAKVITGSKIEIDHLSIGYSIRAFLGIRFEKSNHYSKVLKELQKVSEVINANYTTGSYNVLAEIICRDIKHLKEVLRDKIENIPGIQTTETMICLEETINRPLEIPINR